MKKLSLLLLSSILVLSSCKKDDELDGIINPPDDPLASLTVKTYKRPLLIAQSGINCSACPDAQVLLGLSQHTYQDTVIPLAIHFGTDQFATMVGVDLLTNLAATGMPPEYFVGNTPANDEVEAVGAIIIDKQKTPSAGVSHKVTEQADKFIVDAKVQFFSGAKTFDYFISTYAVERSILATGSLVQAGGQLNNTSGTSVWNVDAGPLNIDMTEFLFNQGDNYYHDYILRAGPDTTGTWGLALAGINPTLDDYFPGDILGTTNTPIRFEITKQSSWNSNNIVFLTILWDYDPGSGVYIYENAFMNSLN